jgi:hypothetical protein
MAFVTIPSSWLDVGDPTKKELFETIKDNLDDLDTRVGTFELSANKVVVFNEYIVSGSKLVVTSAIERMTVFRAPSEMTLLTAILTNYRAGTSGILEVDVKKGTSPSTLTTVFTTKPSISYTAGNNSQSSNAVFAGTITVSQNEYLQLNITGVQTTQGPFHFLMYGEIT